MTKTERKRKLDELMKNARLLIGKTSLVYWKIGKILNRIRHEGLWVDRIFKNGKPYVTFNYFCRGELSFGPIDVYRALRIANSFSEREVAGMSVTQAYRISNVISAKTRSTLVAVARKHGGIDTIEARIRALPKKALRYPPRRVEKTVEKIAELGRWMEDHPRSRISIIIRKDIFIVTISNGVVHVGRSANLREAIGEAVRSTKTRRTSQRKAA